MVNLMTIKLNMLSVDGSAYLGQCITKLFDRDLYYEEVTNYFSGGKERAL